MKLVERGARSHKLRETGRSEEERGTDGDFGSKLRQGWRGEARAKNRKDSFSSTHKRRI